MVRSKPVISAANFGSKCCRIGRRNELMQGKNDEQVNELKAILKGKIKILPSSYQMHFMIRIKHMQKLMLKAL
jgi:hypothetical protein